jgi:phenylalanyl-tRNA synthetase beta chain
MDFFDIKGAMEELARQLGVEGVGFVKHIDGGAAKIEVAGTWIGDIVQLSPLQARKLDLRDVVVAAELRLDKLLASVRAEKNFRELPKFPAVVRDMALVVNDAVSHAEIVAAIEAGRNKDLERVELFDIYTGGSIPTGKKSMAYSLTFRAADRTLTDTEVNGAHELLKRSLVQTLKCEIRES